MALISDYMTIITSTECFIEKKKNSGCMHNSIILVFLLIQLLSSVSAVWHVLNYFSLTYTALIAFSLIRLVPCQNVLSTMVLDRTSMLTERRLFVPICTLVADSRTARRWPSTAWTSCRCYPWRLSNIVLYCTVLCHVESLISFYTTRYVAPLYPVQSPWCRSVSEKRSSICWIWTVWDSEKSKLESEIHGQAYDNLADYINSYELYQYTVKI